MKSLKGQLVIAAPTLETPFFERTVILMIEHTEEGAHGIVLNRPSETTVGEIADQVLDEPFEWDKRVLVGGPVPGPLMIVHDDPDLADRTIIPGVYCCVDPEKVRAAIRSRIEPSLVVVNYAGWGSGQLESEFDYETWMTLPAEIEHVFRDGDDDIWDEVVRAANAKKLSEYLGIKRMPEDPHVN